MHDLEERLAEWLKREPFVRLPTRLILPVALCLAFVGYGTILGLFHLRDGFELYYIARACTCATA